MRYQTMVPAIHYLGVNQSISDTRLDRLTEYNRDLESGMIRQVNLR